MKKCNKCGETKALVEFFKDKGFSDGHSSICKVCKKKATYEWREKNKDVYNAGAKRWRDNNKDKEYGHEIKRRYGLTLEKYNEMLATQDYKCALCNKKHNDKIKRGRLYVDHCHAGGQVRSLLCGGCNSALGYFNDDIELMEKAIAYLRANK